MLQYSRKASEWSADYHPYRYSDAVDTDVDRVPFNIVIIEDVPESQRRRGRRGTDDAPRPRSRASTARSRVVR